WSPDGERLVVAARRSGSHADLFLVEPTGETRQLTDGPGDELAPSWSRDGEWIYFASPRDPDGAWQIYRMPTAGGDAQAITRYGGVAAMEALDGSLLIVRPDDAGLWRLPLGADGLPRDTDVTRLRVNLAPADWANWIVDGAWVYALERRVDGTAAIVRVETGRNEREEIASLGDIPDQPGLGVLPGGERVFLTQIERGDSDIAYVPDFR
ncbi:MAG: hypothetical protein AAF791_15395, partial [Bacteroidota bacterium]